MIDRGYLERVEAIGHAVVKFAITVVCVGFVLLIAFSGG